MKYFQVDTDTFIEYNEADKIARVFSKSETEKQLAFNQAQLSSLPSLPDDKALLTWAKQNYAATIGTEQSKTLLTNQITSLSAKLEGTK